MTREVLGLSPCPSFSLSLVKGRLTGDVVVPTSWALQPGDNVLLLGMHARVKSVKPRSPLTEVGLEVRTDFQMSVQETARLLGFIDCSLDDTARFIREAAAGWPEPDSTKPFSLFEIIKPK